MNPLVFAVLLAEVGALAFLVIYASVLTSMHIEAGVSREPLPEPDPVGRSLVNAAKYGFYLGTLAVIFGSLFLKGLM